MIFLQILKIIGIILLVIIGLILLVLVLLLFNPLKYVITASSNSKDLNVQIKAHYLLNLLGFSVEYNDNELTYYYRIFFKKHYNTDTSNDDENDNIDNVKNDNIINNNAVNDDVFNTIDDNIINEEENNSEIDNNTTINNTEINNTEINNTKEENTNDNSYPHNKESENIFDKLLNKLKSINSKLDSIIKKIQKTRAFFSDESNIAAFTHIKTELIILLKHIKPSKFNMNLTYSTGSPDTTAQLLGLIAMFPIGYKNKWNVVPDFEADEWYINGNIYIKGRIYLFKLIGIGFRLFKDKNCRKLYNYINK